MQVVGYKLNAHEIESTFKGETKSIGILLG